MKLKSDQLARYSGLLVLGITGYFLYFSVLARLDPIATTPTTPNQSIVFARMQELPAVLEFPTKADTSVTFHFNRERVRTLQMQKGLETAAKRIASGFPAFSWQVEVSRGRTGSERRERRGNFNIRGANSRNQEQSKLQLLNAEICLDGRILSLTSFMRPDTNRRSTQPAVSDSQIVTLAAHLLLFDRNRLKIIENAKNDRAFGTVQRVVVQADSVAWSDSLRAELLFLQGHLRRFSTDYEAMDSPTRRSSFEIEIEIAGVVVFIIIFMSLVISLILRLRDDRVEFRNGIRIGITVFAVSAISYLPAALNRDFLWAILKSLLQAPLLGAMTVALTAVAESVARQYQAEKLLNFDLIVRGKTNNASVGSAILTGIGWAGITLALVAGFIWTCQSIKPIAFYVSAGRSESLFMPAVVLSYLGKSFTNAIFLSFVVLFMTVELRTRWPNRKSILVFAVIGVALLPGSGVSLAPGYVALILQLALSLVVVILLIKKEWLTGLVFLFCVKFIPQVAPYWFAPGSISWNGWSGIAVLLFAAIWSLFVLKKTEIKSQTYIPDYLKRIQEKERFQRELEIARNVQLQFLPQKMPRIPWLDVAGHCIPAHEVGGDYFDVFPLSKDRFGLVIGDVAGKGVSAAFFMTLLKGMLKSLTQYAREPVEIVSMVNRLFYENAQRHVFISLIYGIFDQNNRTFRFVRAGHNPVIALRNQSDRVQYLLPPGIAVGLDRGTIFDQYLQVENVTFNSGDIFLFFTDGYTEAQNDRGEEFGEERLAEIALRKRQATAEEILEALQKEVIAFCGEVERHDDMTMMVVKIL